MREEYLGHEETLRDVISLYGPGGFLFSQIWAIHDNPSEALFDTEDLFVSFFSPVAPLTLPPPNFAERRRGKGRQTEF